MQPLEDWLCEQMERILSGDYEDPHEDHNHQAADPSSDAPDLSLGRSETPSEDENPVDGLDGVPPFEQSQTNPVAAVDQTATAPDQPSGPSHARYNHNDINSLFALETIQDDEEAAANQAPDVPDPSPSREQPQHQVDSHDGSIRRSKETILSRQARRQRVSAAMERLEKLGGKLRALREELGGLRAMRTEIRTRMLEIGDVSNISKKESGS